MCMLIGLSQPPPSSVAANAQLRGRVWAQSTAKIKQEIRSWGNTAQMFVATAEPEGWSHVRKRKRKG